MILFVDDEPRKMDSYLEELKFCKYQVKFSSNIEDALNYWHANHKNITLLILDIMMPGSEYINKTLCQNGLRTGIYFYQIIRQDNPEIPIIIFTNVPGVSDDMTNKIKENDDEKVFFLQKEDFLPFQLMEKINKILPIDQFH